MLTRRESIWLCATGVAAAAPARAPLPQQDLFVSGTGGYDTYRIPSLIGTKRRTLLAFCEGRKHTSRDNGDIDIVLRRSTDHGHTWSGALVIHDMGPDTIGNPCPVVDRRTGTIHLLLTSNPGNVVERQIIEQSVPDVRRVWISSSTDDGQTWSKLREITDQASDPSWTWYATGPGVGIQTRSGRLVIPCDHHTRTKPELSYSHCIYSDDRGRTWSRGQTVGEKVNECQVVELASGDLLLNMRSNHQRNRRAVARSHDGGITWGPIELDEALIEPVCQASLIRAGNLLLFSNPASTKRENLTVRLSRDEGRTWSAALMLHQGPAAYSCLAETARGQFACLYERGGTTPYERITFARFRADDLT